MLSRRQLSLATLAVFALAGCSREGELVLSEGVGITAVRSACPAVGIPDYTGDITTFRDASSQLASNLDITAAMTDVESTCAEDAGRIYTAASFNVVARRSDVRGARTVELPYFSTVLRGGSSVVSKRVGTVTLTFADGQERAMATGQAAAYVDRAAATLPEDVRERITRKRKPGDPDAAIDPLSDPEVRQALNRATFELLVGFQLSEAQLAYNATR
ncbi:hypothetical protein [Altererythrobacter sp. MTPC7]|uniref:hypothetical protein n=1 Tax=Altererythrobacter sp. MTPC7 TaxID=3056567 RepID=UPI0036F1A225